MPDHLHVGRQRPASLLHCDARSPVAAHPQIGAGHDSDFPCPILLLGPIASLSPQSFLSFRSQQSKLIVAFNSRRSTRFFDLGDSRMNAIRNCYHPQCGSFCTAFFCRVIRGGNPLVRFIALAAATLGSFLISGRQTKTLAGTQTSNTIAGTRRK